MTTRKTVSSTAAPPIPAATYAGVHEGIVALVQGARHAAARSVNALTTSTYWEIGRRIVEAEQQGKRRANYDDVLVKRSAVDLTAQFGRGFPLAQPVPDARVLPGVARHIADGVCNVWHRSAGRPEIAGGACNFGDRLGRGTFTG